MIASVLLFLVGLVSVQFLPQLPDWTWLLPGVVVTVIIACLRYWRLLFFLIGVIWAIAFATARLSERLPENLEGIDIPVTGFVIDLPERDERHSRFNFIVTRSDKSLPSKLRLSWYYPVQPVKAGEHWSFTVRLKRPNGNFNPGGFDYERWLFTEGIGATGQVRLTPKPILLATDSAWSSISVLRQHLSDQLSLQLVNFPQFAVIKALTLGDDTNITQSQWDVFRKTGTIHLVVISGSHIGLVAGLVYFLIARFWAWTGLLIWSPQKVAALSAMVAGVFYSALAGFSLPILRSVIMLAIAMLAIISQRNVRPFHTLALALFGILLIDPLAVLSPGFWLSFLAVALIIYAIAGRLGNTPVLVEALKINWVTSIGLSPFLLLFFQQVSIISPLANFIAVPVVSLIAVPLSLFATLLMFISPLLATPVFFVVDRALQVLWWILNQLALLPFASIYHTQPSIWALVFALPGILILLAPAGFPARWLGLVMFLPLIFTDSKSPAPGDINLTLLDVGQGLAVVVQTSRHCLVFDTGAKFSSENDSGQSVILPYLRQQGISKIDQLIISHGDNDHIGGAETLLRAMPTEKLLTSVPKQLSEFSPVRCKTGQTWIWDQVKFTILSPPKHFQSDNDNSCVLQIHSAHGSALLTGDIETGAESWLVLNYGEQLKSKLLIAPHHGSKTSSSMEFLTAVQAETVLIPAGYRNQFGHPHQDVLARYKSLHMHCLNTAENGAITVQVVNNNWQVESWRNIASKYWNSNNVGECY